MGLSSNKEGTREQWSCHQQWLVQHKMKNKNEQKNHTKKQLNRE